MLPVQASAQHCSALILEVPVDASGHMQGLRAASWLTSRIVRKCLQSFSENLVKAAPLRWQGAGHPQKTQVIASGHKYSKLCPFCGSLNKDSVEQTPASVSVILNYSMYFRQEMF